MIEPQERDGPPKIGKVAYRGLAASVAPVWYHQRSKATGEVLKSVPALPGVEEPQADPQAETTVWERDETQTRLLTSLAQSVMVLVALHVAEDAAMNLMHEAGACQLTARRFGTSRPDVLAVRSDEFSREAASHGWMVLPPVRPARLLGEI